MLRKGAVSSRARLASGVAECEVPSTTTRTSTTGTTSTASTTVCPCSLCRQGLWDDLLVVDYSKIDVHPKRLRKGMAAAGFEEEWPAFAVPPL